jgi:hypothetical protein
MQTTTVPETEDWLDRFDISAMPDLVDKVAECDYFLSLATLEANREKFRWLISAFLNATYSYFETTAWAAYSGFIDSETGEAHPDFEKIDILNKYVKFKQDEKKPYFVKTTAIHPLIKQMYELRKANTHRTAMSIMCTGSSVPENFHLGSITGEGESALIFCKNIMILIRVIDKELAL